MAGMNPESAKRMQNGFKYFNKFMVFMWRLGLGPWINAWPKVGGQILVITHTGRKSGLKRRTPANFAVIDGELYCTAGFGGRSDWYCNILAHPEVEVWLPDGWWAGSAEDVSGSSDRLKIMRQVLISSGFASFAAGIDPYKISDEDLEAVTDEYKLIRIRRTTPRTGKGGPSDLWWVWPTAVIFLLMFGRKSGQKKR
ncbi:MAG: nitroreductase family deazaflavin-dependent oxidoreductase [Anaerolineaceae bacterium]